jgi:uncharacterized protein with HEPN domain
MEQNKPYRDQQRVEDILGAIVKIGEYLKGVSSDTFLNPRNYMMQDAVVRELEIIGEAVRSLSQEFWKLHPEIPWYEIAGMRNRIAHDYADVDLVIVWDAVQEDLPPLKKVLEKAKGV